MAEKGAIPVSRTEIRGAHLIIRWQAVFLSYVVPAAAYLAMITVIYGSLIDAAGG